MRKYIPQRNSNRDFALWVPLHLEFCKTNVWLLRANHRQKKVLKTRVSTFCTKPTKCSPLIWTLDINSSVLYCGSITKIGIEMQCVTAAKNRASNSVFNAAPHKTKQKNEIKRTSDCSLFTESSFLRYEGYAKDAGRIACVRVSVLNFL